MNIVIIPSALVVPKEQQILGKLPAIIYPADQKIMLDYILERYGDVADSFTVSLYEESESAVSVISEYDEKIKVCVLDTLRDIGYSIYFAMKNSGITEGDSVIINYADVVSYDELSQDINDVVYYSEEKPSSKWAYFSDRDGVIENLVYNPEDITLVKSSKMFIGVFSIKKAVEFMNILEEEINEKAKLDSFFRALLKYNLSNRFAIHKTTQWFDIGHADKYFEAQIEVKARSFNHISIDKNRGTLTKKSDDKNKFTGEILWYLKLPADITYSRPRIFDYSTEYEKPYITMEYYPYHTLHELMLYGNLEEGKWETIFEKIHFLLDDYGRYSVRDYDIKDSLKEMYLEKTINRIKQLEEWDLFDDFWNGEPVINGDKMISLNALINLLPTLIEENLLDVDCFPIIHGDLCFTNIMVDSNCNFIKVIDPRGKFGKYDIYGDRRYELAKLLHSCEGKYDYIIKDKFLLKRSGNDIEFEVKEKKRDFKIDECCIKAFSDFFTADEGRKIHLIEALLFLSMMPLHRENRNRPLAMMCTGMKMLRQFKFI